MRSAQSTASTARQAEFVQIAASKLDAALSEREIEVFLQLLQKVIRARVGFTATARTTGLNRTALYSILSPSGNPTLSTLVLLLSVVGLRLAVEPLGDSPSGNRMAVDSDWEDLAWNT